MSRDLREAIGHYMSTVAITLLREGVPVTGVRASTDWLSPESETDADGDIRFTRALEQRLVPKAEDIALHWSGTSGWCLLVLHDDDHEYYHHARWLGAGLLPGPDRVAAFVSAVQLSPTDAGSNERPFYRSYGEGLEDLHQRLSAFLPPSENWRRKRTYLQNFMCDRAQVYATKVSAALTSQDDTKVDVCLRRGELEAVQHLLEFAQGSEGSLLNSFASHLSDDLASQHPGTGVPAHRATEIAVSIQQQLRERRERGDDL
ncbi:DUF6292 family protein [Streptomyces sp. NPDC048473]|uniref:DUF6292 family protein n=1 Tax=Streptomyces sp. NPDC048473 TaxID=3365556 RepID=UPI00370F9BFC